MQKDLLVQNPLLFPKKTDAIITLYDNVFFYPSLHLLFIPIILLLLLILNEDWIESKISCFIEDDFLTFVFCFFVCFFLNFAAAHVWGSFSVFQTILRTWWAEFSVKFCSRLNHKLFKYVVHRGGRQP